jgi:hypothetical protein
MSDSIENNIQTKKNYLFELQLLLKRVKDQVKNNIYKIDHNLPHKENLMRQPKILAGGHLKEYQL